MSNKIEKEKEGKRIGYLKEKYRTKEYTESHKIEYYLSLGFSWFFNALSGAGAVAFVTMFFVAFAFGNFWAAASGAVAVCVGWEVLKRRVLIRVWEGFYKENKVNLKNFALSFLVVTASIAATFVGTKWMVFELNKGNVEQRSFEQESLLVQSQLDSKNAKLDKYNNSDNFKNSQGIILYEISQRTIPQLEKEIGELESKLIQIEEEIKKGNTEKSETQTIYSENLSWQFAVGVGLSDLLIILLIGFKEKYEYYEAIEKGVIGGTIADKKKDKLDKTDRIRQIQTADSQTSEGQTADKGQASIRTGGDDEIQTKDRQSITDKNGQKLVRNRQEDETKGDYADYLQTKKKTFNSNITTYKRRLKDGKGDPDKLLDGIKKYMNALEEIRLILIVENADLKE